MFASLLFAVLQAKVTCGASASGLTGPGTTLFLQTFETNKDNMFGSIQRIGPDAANAFKGVFQAQDEGRCKA